MISRSQSHDQYVCRIHYCSLLFSVSECDQRVLSTGESNGTIISPNYPKNYPANITCHYVIDGLVDTENLEKAMLSFDYMDLPAKDPNT